MKCGVILCLVASLAAPLGARKGNSKRKITESEVAEVIQAVQDEIYDYGYERDYYQLGQNLATPQHWIARMPIYIDPAVDEHGGEAIYKYMHLTQEVYRLFTLEDHGLVALDLDPELGFPPTQANTKTIYMGDDEVCRMKHDWLRRTFVVDTSPSLDVVKAAARRQVLRTGYSRWQSVVLPHIQAKKHSEPKK